MVLPEEEYTKLLKIQSNLIESEYKEENFFGLLKEITQLVVKHPDLVIEKVDKVRMKELLSSTAKYLLAITGMQEVDSSNIKRIGYSKERNHLFVEFISEDFSLYRYFNVEPETFEAFTNAESKGSFFHKMIRGRYEDEKIG